MASITGGVATERGGLQQAIIHGQFRGDPVRLGGVEELLQIQPVSAEVVQPKAIIDEIMAMVSRELFWLIAYPKIDARTLSEASSVLATQTISVFC